MTVHVAFCQSCGRDAEDFVPVYVTDGEGRTVQEGWRCPKCYEPQISDELADQLAEQADAFLRDSQKKQGGER